MDKTLSSYCAPSGHAAFSDLISKLSSNRTDVRTIALMGLVLTSARDVLDLGCGFGFMSGKIVEKVGPGTQVIGVDACGENEEMFLRTVETAGCRAKFYRMDLPDDLPWSNESFDLIVASYSLYFFVGLLPEIARVLRRNGLFLTITHSEHSIFFSNLYKAVGWDWDRSHLFSLLRNFSAENGTSTLQGHFEDVEKISYENSLFFDADHLDDLLRYVRFKLPLLVPDPDVADNAPKVLQDHISEWLSRGSVLVMDKNDAIFRCRLPKVR
jgi:SAM-dependent methyltransferase